MKILLQRNFDTDEGNVASDFLLLTPCKAYMKILVYKHFMVGSNIYN